MITSNSNPIAGLLRPLHDQFCIEKCIGLLNGCQIVGWVRKGGGWLLGAVIYPAALCIGAAIVYTVL